MPGATALTRIPWGPNSRARARVNPMSPALAALYAAVSAIPTWPSRDAMLTIAPVPRSSIDGNAARQVWKAPVRSVRMTASHSSGDRSRNGPTWVRPALLTSPSIRPKRSTTRPTRRSASVPSAMSAANASPSEPDPRTRSRVRRAPSSERW